MSEDKSQEKGTCVPENEDSTCSADGSCEFANGRCRCCCKTDRCSQEIYDSITFDDQICEIKQIKVGDMNGSAGNTALTMITIFAITAFAHVL